MVRAKGTLKSPKAPSCMWVKLTGEDGKEGQQERWTWLSSNVGERVVGIIEDNVAWRKRDNRVAAIGMNILWHSRMIGLLLICYVFYDLIAIVSS